MSAITTIDAVVRDQGNVAAAMRHQHEEGDAGARYRE